MAIPDGIEDLTPEWLSAALSEGSESASGTVTAVEAEQINVGVGFTGRVYRATLSHERPGSSPASLIVKLHSEDAGIRSTLGELGVGAEVAFYRDLAPDAGIRTPRMYHGGYDPESHRYVLLLEDMAPAPIGDSMTAYPPAHAEALVRQLARFHARWWNDSSLAKLGWLTTPAESAEHWQRLAARAWEHASAGASESISAGAAATIEAMIEHWPRIAAHLSGPPFTLVHGDFKLDNLCFPDGPLGEVVAFDWQIVRRGSGAVDLAYFLPTVDISADREGTPPRIIAAYHDELLQHGVQDYPLEQLIYDTRVASFHFVWIMNFAVGLLDMSSERGQLLVAGIMRRVRSLDRQLDLVALAEADF